MIDIAGGLKITAYLKRAQIDRIIPFEDRDVLSMDRIYTDVNIDQVRNSKSNFEILDGDIIQIFSVLKMRRILLKLMGLLLDQGAMI